MFLLLFRVNDHQYVTGVFEPHDGGRARRPGVAVGEQVQGHPQERQGRRHREERRQHPQGRRTPAQVRFFSCNICFRRWHLDDPNDVFYAVGETISPFSELSVDVYLEWRNVNVSSHVSSLLSYCCHGKHRECYSAGKSGLTALPFQKQNASSSAHSHSRSALCTVHAHVRCRKNTAFRWVIQGWRRFFLSGLRLSFMRPLPD